MCQCLQSFVLFKLMLVPWSGDVMQKWYKRASVTTCRELADISRKVPAKYLAVNGGAFIFQRGDTSL